MSVLDLFPDSARVEQGELEVGGLRASELAREFGTPLIVYCEQTLRARARAYREAAPNALVVFGSKAFPNLAVLRLLAEEGVGADVSTLGELEVARRAGIGGEKIVVHGNNKSDEELRAAAEADVLYLVLDAPDEVERAAAAGIKRALVRVTPGIEPLSIHDGAGRPPRRARRPRHDLALSRQSGACGADARSRSDGGGAGPG